MKFSVIIPVYNKSQTIAESIDSVLNQTDNDFELIIVNDGSTDDLGKVLERFTEIIVINQENGGVSRARNAGIKAASGEYVCFLDADDLWFPDHLAEFRSLLKKYPDAVMLSTSHIETNEGGISYHSNINLSGFDDDFLCDNLFKLLNTKSYSLINTNCICIKKSYIDEKQIYFEPDEKIGEDTDMWYRIALDVPVAISKKETTAYRREKSTATKHGTGSFSWKFAKRWETLKTSEYREDRKKECERLIDRYKLSCARDYILRNERANAKKLVKEVKFRDKRYFLTLILVFMPYSWSKKLITNR